jgi:hypothetical protein
MPQLEHISTAEAYLRLHAPDMANVKRAKELTSKSMPHGAKNHSGFLITINSNVKPIDSAHEQFIADAMREIVGGKLFDNNHFLRMIKWLEGKRDPSLIKHYEAEFAIEVGSQQKRVHAHVLLNCWHNTRIHLDPVFISDYVTKKLNERLIAGGYPKLRGKVYVNIRATKSDWKILKYIRKDAREV